MPDEVNIDELLELSSEEERCRKIRVGGGGATLPSPSPTTRRAPNRTAQADVFIKHFPGQTLNPPQSAVKQAHLPPTGK